MNLHRLAEERSIAYHQAIAKQLRLRPEVLNNARQRVQGWMMASATPPFYARQWAEKLAGDIDSIEAFLGDRSELAIELRQSSPFAGALTPEERWEIWRRVGEEFRAAHAREANA
jgi:hypothetical protein